MRHARHFAVFERSVVRVQALSFLAIRHANAAKQPRSLCRLAQTSSQLRLQRQFLARIAAKLKLPRTEEEPVSKSRSL